MATITWSVSSVVDETGGALDQSQIDAVSDGLVAAGETWARYFDPAADADLTIQIQVAKSQNA